MALNASVVWRVRTDGVETNGGGYDAAVAGAGTDYSDQAAPQLSCTDLVSTASTTITSVIGGFTSAMVGNVLRLASATGSPVADSAGSRYLMITGYTDTNTITVDKTSGTYTLGIGKVGGAFLHPRSLANGGTSTQPTLTSPLIAGNTVMVRGAGTDDPSSADYTQTGWIQFTSGNITAGQIYFLGYNGRPFFSGNGLIFYNFNGHKWENMKFTTTSTSDGALGSLSCGSLRTHIHDCYFDQNGQNMVGAKAQVVTDCKFVNTGSATAGTNTQAAIDAVNSGYNSIIYGCFIKGWRGDGIYVANMCTIRDNIVIDCKVRGIEVIDGTDGFPHSIIGNTINGNTGSGIYLTVSGAIARTVIFNNIITDNGAYGIDCVVNTTALNDRLIRGKFDYNNFGTGATANTSGARNNHSAGAHDVALDPQFTNTATDDYSVGTNMKAEGFPSAFPI